MRRALLGFAIVCAALASGCAPLRPTLRVQNVKVLPDPNGLLQVQAWANIPAVEVPLRSGGGRGPSDRSVVLRAVTDGRELAILAVWPDDVQSGQRQQWIWNPATEQFVMQRNEVDRCALEWPLTPESDFKEWEPHAQRYDLWLWQAGWSEVSGYADDSSLEVKVYPPKTAPETVDGPLFYAPDGKAMIGHLTRLDDGFPGTYSAPRPRRHLDDTLPGALAREPSGSAGDIRVRATYFRPLGGHENTLFVNGGIKTRGEWFGNQADNPNTGYWRVEFYRLLTTADKENDYQIKGPGPHRFVFAIDDDTPWPMRMESPPIELRMPD